MLYEEQQDGSVRCHLCGHRCVIAPGKRGVCHVRENRDGVLEALTYGQAISRNVDPIEKKPLYHYFPGSTSYSIATAGCNFRCPWCQNWEIAQAPADGRVFPVRTSDPESIVSDAARRGCRSIAYTYTEPTVYFEYAMGVAQLAQGAGIGNVFVTNGYMSSEALELLQVLLDAANVDLKAFRETTYKKHIGARLQPVLNTLKAMKRAGIWVEVTTLIVPGINDSAEELGDIADFISLELGPETPWHVSRFHPTFRMTDRPATPVASIRAAREIGLTAGLHYVYVGNVAEPGGGDTRCPQCGRVVLSRSGFSVVSNRIRDGRCPDCNAAIAGVGMDGV
jgi:pyruvate formate lyase activating enzyme